MSVLKCSSLHAYGASHFGREIAPSAINQFVKFGGTIFAARSRHIVIQNSHLVSSMTNMKKDSRLRCRSLSLSPEFG